MLPPTSSGLTVLCTVFYFVTNIVETPVGTTRVTQASYRIFIMQEEEARFSLIHEICHSNVLYYKLAVHDKRLYYIVSS